MRKQTICVTTQLEEELAHALKKAAAKARCSVSSVIREALLQHLGVKPEVVPKSEFTKLQAAVASLEEAVVSLYAKYRAAQPTDEQAEPSPMSEVDVTPEGKKVYVTPEGKKFVEVLSLDRLSDEERALLLRRLEKGKHDKIVVRDSMPDKVSVNPETDE
jgi:hypothetical protein